LALPPLRELHGYYEQVRQRAWQRYSVPHGFGRLGGSLSPPRLGRQCPDAPSPVPRRRSRPGSRRLYAGHRLASKRAPARLIPEPFERPGFDAVLRFSTLQQRSSSWSLPDASPGAFSSSLTTTVFSQRSMRWFEASPHRAAPEGHNPPSSAQHRIRSPTYIKAPSAFGTHANDLGKRLCRATAHPSQRDRRHRLTSPLLVGSSPHLLWSPSADNHLLRSRVVYDAVTRDPRIGSWASWPGSTVHELDQNPSPMSVPAPKQRKLVKVCRNPNRSDRRDDLPTYRGREREEDRPTPALDLLNVPNCRRLVKHGLGYPDQ